MEIYNDITKKGKNISGFYGYRYRYIYLIINALINIVIKGCSEIPFTMGAGFIKVNRSFLTKVYD